VDEFKVPKDQAKVVVKLPPQEPLEGIVFLSSFAEHHRGQEMLSDYFARDKTFLPLKENGGVSVLIRKEAIHWARVAEPQEVEWLFYEESQGVSRQRICCQFSDGETLEGFIYAIAPEGHRRVSDLVNQSQGFLHLECDDALYLVNLSHVTTVRIVEEDLARS
jgi:hypothetical protein